MLAFSVFFALRDAVAAAIKKNDLATGGGHRAGKDSLDPIVEHCRKLGIRALTIFAFSSENWNCPAAEVALLMQLLAEAIQQQIPRMQKHENGTAFYW